MSFGNWDSLEDEWDDNNSDWFEDQQEVELAFDILVHSTEKAHLLQFGERDVWIPMNKATLNMSMHKNTVRVPRWIMREKGLEKYCTKGLTSEEKTEMEEIFNRVVKKNIRKLKEDLPF